MTIIVNLSPGQLAAIINFLLPVIISRIGIILMLKNINDKMTALEWTTISELIVKGPISSYGMCGVPVTTSFKLSVEGKGSYKPKMFINKTDVWQSNLQPLGGNGQMIDFTAETLGAESGENISNNSVLVSENSLWLPAENPPLGNGIGNLALHQQWRKEGTTEESISRI
ncbi:18795_t:CDS:2, partial [Dentiscutata erythropus]